MGSHTNDQDEVRGVLDAIRRIVQALRESSREAERQLGISGAQLFVLRTLAETGALSVNELAERTATHQSSVSVVVQRLSRRGLVARERSASDARRVELRATRAGAALLRRAPTLAQDRLLGAVQGLGRAERRALARVLGRVADEVKGDGAAAEMFFEDRPRRGRRAS